MSAKVANVIAVELGLLIAILSGWRFQIFPASSPRLWLKSYEHLKTRWP